MHCVDLGESFPTHIYLQKSASIQPRTSPVKFDRSPCTDPPGVLSAGVLSPAESRARVVQSRAFSAASNPGAHTDASKEVFRSLTFRREHRALRDAEPRFMDLVCSSQHRLLPLFALLRISSNYLLKQ